MRTEGRLTCLRRERGAALLEVAVTLPLMLLISVGIFEIGRAYQTFQVLTNAAREGTRLAVLPNSSTGDVQARVSQYMQDGQLPDFASATVTVDPNSTINVGGNNVSASVVTVAYPFNFIVLNPVARLVVSGSTLGAAPITITTSSQMRNETQF